MAWAAERGVGVAAVVWLSMALAACGGDGGSTTEPEGPAALAIASGAGQTGVAGAELQQAVGVKVTGTSGEALAGVTVNFSVAGGSGTLSHSSWKTNASGIASVEWTLGTVAGANVDTLVASVSALPGAELTVTASVIAAAPAGLVVISGNAQIGTPGAQAAEPLVVEVHDAFGNPDAGIIVSWSAEGGGTLSAAKDTTDAQGHASVLWTLGAGDNRVSAAIAELADVVAPFAASLTASDIVKLLTVSPATLVEGGSATLTGTGFSASLAGNKVYVDGSEALVTGASESTIQITVPAFDCRPTRSAPVRVVVGSEGSNAVKQQLLGEGTTVSLATGEQLIVSDPSKFCLQLGESATPASYLVGAQSVSALASSLTPVTVSAAAAPSEVLAMRPAPLPLASRMMASGAELANVLVTPDARRWNLHRAAEAKLRASERELLTRRARAGVATMQASASVATARIPATVEVGDTLSISFPDINHIDPNTSCPALVPITTVVRAKGTKGIWLEDVGDPAGGYSASDFESLSDAFDNEIFATDVAYFGEPTDYDENGRVVVVTTKEVNKIANVLGFVISSDFPLFGCSSSNGGEFYYGRAPDPDGSYTSPAPYSLDDARQDAPILIAHEFTHVIQFGRRLNVPGAEAFQTPWEAEGQATLAQEVVGNDYRGLAPGNNYGFGPLNDGIFGGQIDWYGDAFLDVAIYFGYKGDGIHSANAPEQCTWLGKGSGGPCITGRETYGVPWSFLRWLSDQFGPGFAGGEKGLQKALIDNPHSGFATIEEVTGADMNVLLAQWAASLYMDDLSGNDNPRLRFTSWNLPDIFGHLPVEARLTPRAHAFQSFSDAVSVRGGSTAYFTISGSSATATAVKLRDASGLPISGGPMQLWIVRLQ